jgi:hypothetical protein
MQAAKSELAKFELKEIAFRQAERGERAAKVGIPKMRLTSRGADQLVAAARGQNQNKHQA